MKKENAYNLIKIPKLTLSVTFQSYLDKTVKSMFSILMQNEK